MRSRRRFWLRGEPAVEDHVSIEALGVEAGWGSVENPEDAVSRQEQTAIVRAAVDALGPEDRRVLVLRDLEGLDGEETAEVLGVSVAAVKSRLHRARLRFAAKLRKERGGGG